MKYKIATTVEPDFVRVTATGEYAFEDLPGFISELRNIALANAQSKLLIDCRQLDIDMTEAERFAGGQRVAEIFRSKIKAALVMPPGQVTKLGELAAVNRGARFLVTTSESEALKWLAG
ncbi:MAG TPA: hypothetical protein PLP21_12085 [Pyrinomonadaceae bacterium]|nr:hypothetical protein [Acidobacteriota bacterium]HQZ97050.1 hypothetical protein [Pyrinomonadaceae bacterium]